MTADFDDDIADLESAEDFLDYFGIDYEPQVLQVNRLHILQRAHDYLSRGNAEPDYGAYRACFARAYEDFVHSDALTEKVFKVLQRASGIATVPLTAIGHTRH